MRRRAHRHSASVGTSRWFGRYRVGVLLGWLLVIGAASWVLTDRRDTGTGVTAPRREAALPAAAVGKIAAAPAAQPAGPAGPMTDDAPHANAIEWWQYSGHLRADSGERYSFRITTFLRQGAAAETVFHGSLLDHASDKHYTEQARTEGNPSHGSQDGFDFSFGTWRIKREGTTHLARMAGQDFAADLRFEDARPPVRHQAPGAAVAGRLDFGAAGQSYYTSRPRLRGTGTVTINGVEKSVAGEVWFDHQWGDFEASRLRWNWFALQLADGADLMLYELFDRQGETALRMGTYMRDDKVTPLGPADFTASAKGRWRSPSSRVVYPMDWTISVPGKGVKVKLVPVIRHSQFNALATTRNVYWEGAVNLSGSPGGVGFMELNGYEPAPEPKKK